ncbi:MAG TPA: hypothetical protein VHX15_08910 [Frankiaceae bacterium]|jgi:hypothetical protein|nr:hypothetical protein [Frankiaceae bacterium]
MTDLIWSFAPWISFLLGVRVGNVFWGAGVGAVVAIVVLARAISHGRAHLFDYVGVVYFVAMLVVLAIVRPGDVGTWGRYAQAVAHGSLTLIVFGSVLFNRPFTEPYAREQASKELWGSPVFRAFNRRLSAMWGLAFLVGTISLVAAGATDSRQILLRVIVPFGALAAAFTYTQKQAARATTQPAHG